MKEYNKLVNLKRVRLEVSDLSELVVLMREGFDDSDRLYIKTVVGDARIEEQNLELFLQQSLPNKLDNLEIRISQYTEGNNKKSIILRLGYSSYISIGSLDQTWLLGKEAQLVEYLKGKRPVLFFLTPPIKSFLLGGLLVLYFVPGIPYIGLLIANKVTRLESILAVLLELMFVIISISLNKLDPAIITIKDVDSILKKYSWAIALILSCLGLVATIVIGVMQLRSHG